MPLIGKVSALQSRHKVPGGIPYTTFNVTIIKAVKPAILPSHILIRQGGYDDGRQVWDVANDPLMEVGNEYMFFLNEVDTPGFEYVRSMGAISMFDIRDDKVYPSFETWAPQISGDTLDEVLVIITSYLK